MVRHNNVVPNQHFHKKWTRRVKTWFQQPIQKKIRRDKRKSKALESSPRPAQGVLRPLVQCPTQKYNSKQRQGRGFTLDELKEAKLSPKFALTIGIAIDHRRTNKCLESLNLNVRRLKEYASRLVLFPRKSKKIAKGEASKDLTSKATQLKGKIIVDGNSQNPISFVNLSDELTKFGAHSTLRNLMNSAKLVGIRSKKSKESKDGDKSKNEGED